MNEQIRKLADQARFAKTTDCPSQDEVLEKFAELVAAAEREACAKLVEEYPHWIGLTAKAEISNAIRARG